MASESKLFAALGISMWPFSRLTLFWKIFLWFWLAMALMVGLSVFSWLQVRDSIHFYPAGVVMQKSLSRLEMVLTSDKSSHWQNRAIRNLLRSQSSWLFDASKRRRAGSVYFLIDDGGKEKDNKKIPEAVSALGNTSKSSQRLLFATHKDQLFVGPKAIRIGLQRYDLYITQSVGRFHSRILWHVLHSISIWQVFGYLIISVLLCSFLAYSITRPIKKLQGVSRRLAAGENVLATEVLQRTRDEFYSLAMDLDQMTQKILASTESQKQLLSDVSHELRSPLARLQIAAGLIEKGLEQTVFEQSEDVAHSKVKKEWNVKGLEKNVARIQVECMRMDTMIGQLLNIAALDRGQIYEPEQTIDLVALLLELKEDAAFEAIEKGIEIKTNINNLSIEHQFDHHVSVRGYYQLLRSAIENIVRNAIRYSPENRPISIELITARGVEISVMDCGEGIPEEDLEKVFLPFFRADTARDRERGGTGLGLAISARSIRAMNGNIEAMNLPEGGFKVCIRLPELL